MNFDLSVVIPTWNGLHLLRDNLPSVLAAARAYRDKTGRGVEIIVVDDGSRDETPEAIPREFPEICLAQRTRNRGFAAACNSGIQSCRSPLVALLNNDVRIDEAYFIYQALHFQDPDVFAVTAKVFESDQPIFAAGGRVGRFRRGFWSVYFNYDASTSEARNWIEQRKLLSAYAVGGFSTYSRAKLKVLDGFNELLSPFQWEDVDLSYRGWKRGWKVHYEPRSIAYHKASSTIDAHYRKYLVDTVSFRNRLLFHWINLHSPSYFYRHLLMLLILLPTRILVLDLSFYHSLSQALSRVPALRRHRVAERAESRRTDAEIARLLKDFYRSAPIEIYYNQREVIERHPEFEKAL